MGNSSYTKSNVVDCTKIFNIDDKIKQIEWEEECVAIEYLKSYNKVLDLIAKEIISRLRHNKFEIIDQHTGKIEFYIGAHKQLSSKDCRNLSKVYDEYKKYMKTSENYYTQKYILDNYPELSVIKRMEIKHIIHKGVCDKFAVYIIVSDI